MEFLVEMTLAAQPETPEEGMSLMEIYILPTLAIAEKLKEENKIISGGPIVGKIAIAIIVKADSAQELDSLISSLPVWSRMVTTVTPLTSFTDRENVVRPLLETIKDKINGKTFVQV